MRLALMRGAAARWLAVMGLGLVAAIQAHAVGGPQGATVAPGAKIELSDVRWLEKVARAGIGEVELGKLAATQGKAEQVRSYGQTMVDDHTKGNEELRRLAESKGVLLPDKADNAQQRLMKRLVGLKDEKFDKAYIDNAGAKLHTDLGKLFQDGMDKLKDPDLKDFAAKGLPQVKRHFDMSREIISKMGPPPKRAQGK